MDTKLQVIADAIQNETGLSDTEKQRLIRSLEEADKSQHLLKFKLERLEHDRQTLSVMLEESIQDLEKKSKAIEEQNHELEIESTLEKVRSVAMGMKKRDDMLDVCKTIAQQLESLKVKEVRNVQTAIFYDEKGFYTNYEYYAKHDKLFITDTEFRNHPIAEAFANQMMKGPNEVFIRSFSGKEVTDWLDYQKATNVFIDSYLETAPSLTYYWYSLGPVALGISTYVPLNEEEMELFRRFRNVFELSYRRYSDIEKAEEQAREARIEAALERVRSRTMAMHRSQELSEVILVVSEQLQKMEFRFSNVSFIINNEEYDLHFWSAAPWLSHPFEFHVPYLDSIVVNRLKEAQKKGLDFFADVLTPEENNRWLRHMVDNSALNQAPEDTKNYLLSRGAMARSLALAKHITLVMANYEGKPYTEEENAIFKRFANVFEQSYTRFLDLQKAEAQAREAEIELALERVRAKTMAMQRQNDLLEVTDLFAEQLIHLGVDLEIVNFSNGLSDGDWDLWVTSPTSETTRSTSRLFVPWIDHPYFQKTRLGLHNFKNGIDLNVAVFNKEEKDRFLDHLFSHTSFKDLPDLSKAFLYDKAGFTFSAIFLKETWVSICKYDTKPFSDRQHGILRRFANAFGQAYTRFLDLQKAEAQAKEAQVETALERVRSRTLAMQKSDELADTAAVLFQQMILLGIEPNRLYIGIIKDETGDIEAWATDEDGSKVSKQFTLSSHNYSVKKMYDAWKEQNKSIIIDMQGEELQDYLNYLHDELDVPFRRGLSQKRRIQHLAFFGKGFIGMASPDEQPAETLQLLERFAYVFNLTYTRFNDLQLAEAHALQAEQDLIEIKAARKKAEDALMELQATQKQLVQSEKMASLGELTAGIAHEIQNPLNFVNNFSEVSNELIEELRMKNEKLKIKDREVNELLNDITQNLEKINFHGKRADAIVKSMLQHSRTSSGKKEPTDINALCDEYLRLAYHGLRAKDKSFNAKFETDFDDSIGKINIIPQEIGRVILNLINNAFYAVSEKAASLKPQAMSYEPKVKISTAWIPRTQGGLGVQIKVIDNGAGIPQKLLDKIFQPFFTTKPTGEGTGLGLSLSYDIVTKGHGGEFKVETKEGKGSEFTILLPV